MSYRIYDLAPSEGVKLAHSIKRKLAAEAKRRQAHGLTAPGRTKQKKSPHLRTRDALAARCGMSAKTLQMATFVVDAARRDPDRFGDVVKRMDETGNVSAAYRAVLFPDTQRMMSRPAIFSAVTIGDVPLGEFTAAELRWLFALCTELAKHLGAPASDRMRAPQLFSVGQVKKAIRRAEAKGRAR